MEHDTSVLILILKVMNIEVATSTISLVAFSFFVQCPPLS